jgi:hypothetical protein
MGWCRGQQEALEGGDFMAILITTSRVSQREEYAETNPASMRCHWRARRRDAEDRPPRLSEVLQPQ